MPLTNLKRTLLTDTALLNSRTATNIKPYIQKPTKNPPTFPPRGLRHRCSCRPGPACGRCGLASVHPQNPARLRRSHHRLGRPEGLLRLDAPASDHPGLPHHGYLSEKTGDPAQGKGWTGLQGQHPGRHRGGVLYPGRGE